ncbi:MAG: MFS transporter [Frankia sp.]
MTPARRDAALTPVLVFTTMVAAVISSLGAPLLPSIASSLRVPLSTAQWALTVALLAGAVSAPIMGRLGDGPRRRETMVAGLVAVTLGGVIAALAHSLPLLVVGRALQGIGLGMVPLTMAAARDHLPRDRVHGTIALLSICTAAGVGIGYPVSGLIADSFGLSADYWFGAVVSGVALLCVVVVVPTSTTRTAEPLDLPGVALLTAGLVALLLAIAQGSSWGWTSITVLGLIGGAAVALTAWVFQELRADTPLVELRLLRHPAVLTGDSCAIVLGVAMYMYTSAVTEFVQAPRSTGYGFSASVVVAGLCLVPLSATSLLISRALPWFTEQFGVRPLLPLGSLAVAAAGTFFALFHTSLWQALVMMGVVGVGIGSTSAAIPGLIVGAVPDRETGSAMGFYQVVRYIGFSLGSGLTASVLAGRTPAGRPLPTEGGYTLVMWIATVVCVAAAAVAWFLPARGASRPSPVELAAEQGDAELGPAGYAELTRD